MWLSRDITPGNPFAQLGRIRLPCGKYNVYLVIFTEFFVGKCSFGWILLIGMYSRAFIIGYRYISVWFCVCETSRCASYILLERANGLLQRPPSALCRRITWLPLMNPARSCFNLWGQGSIAVKNTDWNDILFDKCRKILKLDTNKQNQSWIF